MATIPELELDAHSSALRQIAEDAPEYPDYQALDTDRNEIRLLDLGLDHKYELRHVSLDKKPDYIALSYYWGAPGEVKPIWVNGYEIFLRKHVRQFLKALVKQMGCITVWLDVVCINQRNPNEQSSQVSMMGKIYSQASRVCCWMGDNADIGLALKLMSKYSKTPESCISDDISRVVRGLRQIFCHQYWTRIWIIQEFALNSKLDLVTSSNIAPWSDVCQFDLHPAPDRVSEDWKVVFEKFVKLRQTPAPFQQDLLSRLDEFGNAQCSDRLDRIYGLRALAHDGHKFDVNYRKNPFDLVVELSTYHHAEILQSREFNVDASDLPYDPGILYFGETLYNHMYCKDLMAKSDLLVEYDALVDKKNDWLTIRFAPVKRRRMDKGPELLSWISQGYYELNNLMNTDVWMLFRPHTGYCEDVRIQNGWIYRGSLFIPNETPRQLFQQMFRTHTWLCAARPGIHISRVLFAALLCAMRDIRALYKDRDMSSASLPFSDNLMRLLQDHAHLTPSPDIMRCKCDVVAANLMPKLQEEAALFKRNEEDFREFLRDRLESRTRAEVIENDRRQLITWQQDGHCCENQPKIQELQARIAANLSEAAQKDQKFLNELKSGKYEIVAWSSDESRRIRTWLDKNIKKVVANWTAELCELQKRSSRTEIHQKIQELQLLIEETLRFMIKDVRRRLLDSKRCDDPPIYDWQHATYVKYRHALQEDLHKSQQEFEQWQEGMKGITTLPMLVRQADESAASGVELPPHTSRKRILILPELVRPAEGFPDSDLQLVRNMRTSSTDNRIS